jgi:hypothetical protein
MKRISYRRLNVDIVFVGIVRGEVDSDDSKIFSGQHEFVAWMECSVQRRTCSTSHNVCHWCHCKTKCHASVQHVAEVPEKGILGQLIKSNLPIQRYNPAWRHKIRIIATTTDWPLNLSYLF